MKSKPYIASLIGVFLLTAVLSCDKSEEKSPYRGYKKISDRLFFRYEAMSDENIFPQPKDFLTAELSYGFYPSDSIFFRSERKFQLLPPDDLNSISNVLFKLGKGDSASVIINTKLFFEHDLDTVVPDFLKDDSIMIIHIRIKDIEPYGKFVKRVQHLFRWIRFLSEKEILFDTFAAKMSLFARTGRMMKIKIDTGNGIKVEEGDTVTINYEGYFFDGRVFDSTYKVSKPFSFVYGTEKQVIPAFDLVLKYMEEKEKSLYIVPPELAFGKKGVDGIVPPNTPLVFLLEVDTVKKNMGYE